MCQSRRKGFIWSFLFHCVAFCCRPLPVAVGGARQGRRPSRVVDGASGSLGGLGRAGGGVQVKVVLVTSCLPFGRAPVSSTFFLPIHHLSRFTYLRVVFHRAGVMDPPPGKGLQTPRFWAPRELLPRRDFCLRQVKNTLGHGCTSKTLLCFPLLFHPEKHPGH